MKEPGPALGLLLAPLGWLYGGAMRFRNQLYARGVLRTAALPVPVISVGNLTVGGTGKTPLVSWLVDQLAAAGKRPGVLARGYGRAPRERLNDEGRMLAARHQGLLQVQAADRVRAGRQLVAELGADVVVVDDGFQHRRLARDRDLVCLDARFDPRRLRVLPAGSLREPVAGLARADAIIWTRAEAEPPQLEGFPVPVFRSVHAVRDLVRMPGGESEPSQALSGRRVVLLSAIARPETFQQTATRLGAKVMAHIMRRDHHRWNPTDLAEAAALARRFDAWLVTTEKDEAKLTDVAIPRHVLRIELRFLGAQPELEWLLQRRRR